MINLAFSMIYNNNNNNKNGNNIIIIYIKKCIYNIFFVTC